VRPIETKTLSKLSNSGAPLPLSLSIGRSEGVSKALFDKHTHRLLGMGICGTNAGELIAEPTLAIEV
jgi:pyruvate/2-oxoglutarate dehydrogenase complex dihydrolipoamide dehydrogenase (E3) component